MTRKPTSSKYTDWPLARALYLAQVPLGRIAEEVDIPYSYLKRRLHALCAEARAETLEDLVQNIKGQLEQEVTHG